MQLPFCLFLPDKVGVHQYSSTACGCPGDTQGCCVTAHSLSVPERSSLHSCIPQQTSAFSHSAILHSELTKARQRLPYSKPAHPYYNMAAIKQTAQQHCVSIQLLYFSKIGGRDVGHQQQACGNTTACVSDSTELKEPDQCATAVNDSLFVTCHLVDTSAQ